MTDETTTGGTPTDPGGPDAATPEAPSDAAATPEAILPEAVPADDAGADLARRRFFRQFANDVVHTAATFVGMAGALQRTSAEAASAILGGTGAVIRGVDPGTADPAGLGGLAGSLNALLGDAPPGPADSANPGPASPTGFRTAFRWNTDELLLVDQRKLPGELVEVRCETAAEVAWALREMVIRGAPAMGQAAAIGLALTAARMADATPFVRRATLRGSATALVNARPTAVNVRWATDRCLAAADAIGDLNPDGRLIADAIRREAEEIIAEAAEDHERLATLGLAELPTPRGRPLQVMTHCNTGPLACGQFGTALGVVQAAVHAGRDILVFVDETRPYLQGARLTAWELAQAGVTHTLIADGAAGWVLSTREVDAVLVGADRIAANGDTANKIGTYPLAVLAQRHGVPFFVCAPTSSVDLDTPDGRAIQIEQRAGDEVTSIRGVAIAPPSTPALNPAFDVTPADLVTAIVTEAGVLRPPYADGLAAAVAASRARRRTAISA